MKAKKKEPMAIQVIFKKGIRTDGELLRVRIVQDDQELSLTQEQALSLAEQLNRKFL